VWAEELRPQGEKTWSEEKRVKKSNPALGPGKTRGRIQKCERSRKDEVGLSIPQVKGEEKRGDKTKGSSLTHIRGRKMKGEGEKKKTRKMRGGKREGGKRGAEVKKERGAEGESRLANNGGGRD